MTDPGNTTVTDKPFDPSKYLTRVSGSDYLEVKWRLLWLRQTQPDATIETELVSHSDSFAVFRAKVALPKGGSATGWGSEGLDDFRDYIEKAETKAIGRALAALGFGTQFCPDFEFGAQQGRVVDSPIDVSSTRGRPAASTLSANRRPPPSGQQVTSPPLPATPSQLKFCQDLAREVGLSDEQLDEAAVRLGGKPLGELGRRDTSALIEWLQARRGEVALELEGDDVLDEYAGRIRAAKDIAQLQAIGKEMASAGVASDELRRLYHEQGQSFGAGSGSGKR